VCGKKKKQDNAKTEKRGKRFSKQVLQKVPFFKDRRFGFSTASSPLKINTGGKRFSKVMLQKIPFFKNNCSLKKSSLTYWKERKSRKKLRIL
jgi:hypothetical protein